MLVLSIDTSTTVCSVALHSSESGADGSHLLGAYELFTERTSSAMLTTLISDVVRHTGHELRDINAVAVAKGPGSYTGLRIGTSTAKGLCFALDKPLLAVNTLQAMTEQVRPVFRSASREAQSALFCPMIDARRMEVYCALYDGAGHEVMPTSAKIIDEQSFQEWLITQVIVFFGDGAAKCRPILTPSPNAVFVDELIRPSARTVGRLAVERLRNNQVEDLAAFEPFYLKEFMTTKPKKTLV